MIAFKGEGGRTVAVDPAVIIKVFGRGAKAVGVTLELVGGTSAFVAERFATVVRKIANAKKK